MIFKKVTHVLFDMDGLILNTEALYMEVFQTVASRYGDKQYTFDLKYPLMGLQIDDLVDGAILALELPLTRDQFIAEARELYEKFFPDVELMPGAKELIEHLHKHNVPIGLATSSSKESYNLKVQKRHQELFSLFPYKTWGSSDPAVKKGKPSPDIFLVAANKFPDKPKPEQCLVLEDAVNGVRAAAAAGMQVVMVPDPRLPRHETCRATHSVPTLRHFRPELFGLPPYPTGGPDLLDVTVGLEDNEM